MSKINFPQRGLCPKAQEVFSSSLPKAGAQRERSDIKQKTLSLLLSPGLLKDRVVYATAKGIS
jgi:hypothetical protein